MRWSWLLLLTSCATWSPAARVAGVAAVSTIAVDCAVTQYFLATDSTWTEANPLMGRRPSPVRLWSLCAAGAVLTLGAANHFAAVRIPVLVGTVVVETWVTLYNLNLIRVPLWRID